MSDSEDHLDEIETEKAPPKIVIKRKPSIIPFQFVEIEAVESDGEGGDVDNAEDFDDEDDDGQDESMTEFVRNAEEIHTDDDIDDNDTVMQHIQIRNQLNAALDAADSEDEADDDDANVENRNENEVHKQQLLHHLLRTNAKKSGDATASKTRYFDAVLSSAHTAQSENTGNDDENSGNESSSSSDDDDYVDSSDEVEADDENDKNTGNETENENKNMSDELNETEKVSSISELSKLDFQKLVSQTLCNFALKFEQQQQQEEECTAANQQPFVDSMADEIALDVDSSTHALDMRQLTAFLGDDDDVALTALTEGESVLAAPKLSSSNHVKNLAQSKLDNTTLSGGGNTDKERNTFVHEEIRLAEQTMKQAITRRMNQEQQNVAQPLSSQDPRCQVRERGRPNAGKAWFNLPAGKLTAENKLHFVMLKHRHMLYRSYKPTKVRDTHIPKHFAMGKVIEGPTEFYSDRMTKKNRANSWANEYLKDQSTKQW
eukprot:CAMPEP_0202693216 /NCGR_PEP_ID=MMETSP1385-20130828/7395_1 /ASSEMBLY_ACC=CAM_ASM_000861 /TAXON_ID=933848 /ORGANISM="Elphidium margaritaceum" /LENGTH=488 /DNA_ID=CAMNT_0049348869 /DNA_START=41 /DNA_END=1504 /DNA_ORIENTATION=+